MKPKSLAVTLLGCAIVGAAALLPTESSGQAGASAEEAQTQQILVEVIAQQTVIAENQTKIDEKVVAIGEEIRLARIYAGRAGGKAK